ncbi:MAG: hypothetical protein Q9214_000770 [Letrouitia sp. 1 TL-2023]
MIQLDDIKAQKRDETRADEAEAWCLEDFRKMRREATLQRWHKHMASSSLQVKECSVRGDPIPDRENLASAFTVQAAYGRQRSPAQPKVYPLQLIALIFACVDLRNCAWDDATADPTNPFRPRSSGPQVKNDRIYGSTLKNSYPPAAGAAEISKPMAIQHGAAENSNSVVLVDRDAWTLRATRAKVLALPSPSQAGASR